MSFRGLATLAVVALAFVPIRQSALAQSPGFTYCVPPARPGCIAAARGADAVCDSEVKLFVSATFQYRECLARETERAVRDANDAIGAWRCRVDKKKCRQ